MKQYPSLWSKEKKKRRCRNGMSRSCRRCCLVTVEEGHQEEALKKQAEKNSKQRRNAERDKLEIHEWMSQCEK